VLQRVAFVVCAPRGVTAALGLRLLAGAEIMEYAYHIGMDPEEDTRLLWIAKEGLKAQLPPNWKPCEAPVRGPSHIQHPYHSAHGLHTPFATLLHSPRG
jgi:hypothetical protein